jgi:tetratricopeptide (TPR) repeat protein
MGKKGDLVILVFFFSLLCAFCSTPESGKEGAPAAGSAAGRGTAAPSPAGTDNAFQTGVRALFAKNWQEARGSFEAVKPEDPNYLTALHNLGILAEQASDYPKALAYHKKILEIDPKNAEAHANLGWLYFLERKYPESIQESKTALTYNPHLLTALYNLGLACAADDDYARAIEAYERAVGQDPSKADRQTAIDDLTRFLSQKPGSVAARSCLAFLYRSAGETSREKEELKKVLQTASPGPLKKAAEDRLGELEKAQGTAGGGNP